MPTQLPSTMFEDLDVEVKPDANIGSSTYFKIGGRADALVHPHSPDSLTMLSKRCHNEGIPLRILGRGANLLVDDTGVDGIVVKLDHPCFNRFRFDTEGTKVKLHVMAGKDVASLLMESARCGYEGLEGMAGIPCTIGGAIRMNAGGRFGSISDSIQEITCLKNQGKLITYKKGDVGFGYRESRIPDPIILSATFELRKCDPELLRNRILEIFDWKTARQPLADSSAGCAFKNPKDDSGERISAGKLIDKAGLKGHSFGGASVSYHHANFIVTNQKATAKDVLSLMKEVKDRVQDSSGISLQEEVVIWSKDPEVQR